MHNWNFHHEENPRSVVSKLYETFRNKITPVLHKRENIPDIFLKVSIRPISLMDRNLREPNQNISKLNPEVYKKEWKIGLAYEINIIHLE